MGAVAVLAGKRELTVLVVCAGACLRRAASLELAVQDAFGYQAPAARRRAFPVPLRFADSFRGCRRLHFHYAGVLSALQAVCSIRKQRCYRRRSPR